jgi:hypothetical protein
MAACGPHYRAAAVERLTPTSSHSQIMLNSVRDFSAHLKRFFFSVLDLNYYYSDWRSVVFGVGVSMSAL